ncbi:MAG: hypothetical protein ACKVQS_06750 [Fimbriimonadaceae bacterium]
MTEQPEKPQTASCAIPLTAFGIAAVLFVIAGPISKNLIGTPLKALEKEAAPIAIQYIKQSANSQPTQLADPKKFNEPAFKTKLSEVIGPYQTHEITKLGTEKTSPPTFYITLNIEGQKGKGIATIALQKQNNEYRVVNAGIYPR